MNKDAVLKELRRELAMRHQLYPGWVSQGKLSQKTADHRIEAIEWAIAAIERLPEEEKGDRLQMDLFGSEVA